VQLGNLPVGVDFDDLGVREAGEDLLASDGVAGVGLGVDAADLKEALRGGWAAHGCGHTLFT
jgi:hypothetical protein